MAETKKKLQELDKTIPKIGIDPLDDDVHPVIIENFISGKGEILNEPPSYVPTNEERQKMEQIIKRVEASMKKGPKND